MVSACEADHHKRKRQKGGDPVYQHERDSDIEDVKTDSQRVIYALLRLSNY